jgi:acetyl-CoA carboxylase, biotin carboxylase subunit
MLKKVAIANRGEVALRILRACKELGIKTVALHSVADKDLMHVRLADQSVCIGANSPTDSYLNVPAIISACEITDADAIHPGYGFLAENADFAEQVVKSDFTFIGPSAKTIRLMGNKISALEAMRKSGVPTLPNSNGMITSDKQAINISKKIGYPVILKAAAGGGGRGMRVAHTESALLNALHVTRNEAKAAFGDDSIYIEKYLESPRHVEVQVLSDGQGNAIHLGDRDCSFQRKHQKVIEEAPANNIDEKERKKVLTSCVQACLDMQYTGAGTFEFLYDKGQFYFIEMNTRLQVEHPVTEMVTGVDIVKQQLLIAGGNKLAIKQSDINITSHAIECRINAEDPITFIPSPGQVKHFHAPGGNGIRIDSHLYNGYKVPPFYDSLIGKIIAHGVDKHEAIIKMKIALEEFYVKGIVTNVDMHKRLIADIKFATTDVNVNYLDSL